MNTKLYVKKSLYYLNKGKVKEAIQALDFILPILRERQEYELFIQASTILSEVLYQKGERFPEIYLLLQESLKYSSDYLESDEIGINIEKITLLVKELDDYFIETNSFFKGMDLSDFWNKKYANEYLDVYPTPHIVKSIEAELGYRLPAAYIYLMRHSQNGGTPHQVDFILNETLSSQSPAELDTYNFTGIMGLGRTAVASLGGSFSTAFWQNEWGYPDIGVVIADCPSAGHDLICLDYRKCSSEGEPSVVHISETDNYRITYLAKDFEAFIRGLKATEETEANS